MSPKKLKKAKKPIKLRRRRRRIPLALNARKAMFVLPNLFTLSSVFFGFYAINHVIGSPGPDDFYKAGLAVFFGLFFDMADGRVARMTKTQSDFGVQLDSLADLITFGVAPAVIIHQWSLKQLGFWGLFVSFVYLAAGALRLARFNVLAARGDSGPSNNFIGLPIPLAAGILMTLVMFHSRTIAMPVTHVANVLTLVLVMAYLMVSNIRYRTFKNLKISKYSIAAILLISISTALIGTVYNNAFAMLTLFSAYVMMGLVEEVVFFKKRWRIDIIEKEESKAAELAVAAAKSDTEANTTDQ